MIIDNRQLHCHVAVDVAVKTIKHHFMSLWAVVHKETL